MFRSFQEHEVRCLVIGGIAAVLHGVPRATFDLDILIEATPDNAQRLLDALRDAGFATATLTSANEIMANDITILKDRVRIDVRSHTPGLSFEEAWVRKDRMVYRNQEFFVVCKQDLIAAKTASGRPVDLEDVCLLQLSRTRGDEGEERRQTGNNP